MRQSETGYGGKSCDEDKLAGLGRASCRKAWSADKERRIGNVKDKFWKSTVMAGWSIWISSASIHVQLVLFIYYLFA